LNGLLHFFTAAANLAAPCRKFQVGKIEMSDAPPIVLIPGLGCSARLYAAQIPALWRVGPVTVADHRRDDSMAAIARRILAAAPPKFALAGLSMGGYIAFEIMRQAPQRVAKLALLDTGARAEAPEQTERRKVAIELATSGRYAEVVDIVFPIYVHRKRHNDAALKAIVQNMAEDTGAEAFLRQQHAIIHRPDSRPGLGAIKCPTLVLVGDDDQATPLELSREIAAGIAGSRLVVIPESGHLSTLEQPAKVSEVMLEWLRS
jgi:pimeloyl-ACP methyl ester carboxylesterase